MAAAGLCSGTLFSSLFVHARLGPFFLVARWMVWPALRCCELHFKLRTDTTVPWLQMHWRMVNSALAVPCVVLVDNACAPNPDHMPQTSDQGLQCASHLEMHHASWYGVECVCGRVMAQPHAVHLKASDLISLAFECDTE